MLDNVTLYCNINARAVYIKKIKIKIKSKKYRLNYNNKDRLFDHSYNFLPIIRVFFYHDIIYYLR